MIVSPIPRSVRAIHEAAHAVLAHLSGLRVEAVSVQEQSGRLGCAELEEIMDNRILDAVDLDRLELIVLDVAVALAGPEAQARIAPELAYIGCEHDLELAAVGRGCCGEDLFTCVVRPAADRWIAEVLDTHWVLVDRVASRLEQTVNLDGKALEEMIGPLPAQRGGWDWPELQTHPDLVAEAYSRWASNAPLRASENV